MLRTHTCGELTKKNVGHEVTLCGWVDKTRDHGGVTFIDLRDRSGLAQVVFNAKIDASLHDKAKALGAEFVVRIEGVVRRRPKGTENPKLASGMVEVGAVSLAVLNRAEVPPFEIGDETDASEEVRM